MKARPKIEDFHFRYDRDEEQYYKKDVKALDKWAEEAEQEIERLKDSQKEYISAGQKKAIAQEQEIKELREANDIMQDKCIRIELYDNLKQENEKLREYTEHHSYCKVVNLLEEGEKRECNCGLEQALKK